MKRKSRIRAIAGQLPWHSRSTCISLDTKSDLSLVGCRELCSDLALLNDIVVLSRLRQVSVIALEFRGSVLTWFFTVETAYVCAVNPISL